MNDGNLLVSAVIALAAYGAYELLRRVARLLRARREVVRDASDDAHAGPTLLHHISLGVRDLTLAAGFYDAALGALGYRRVFEDSSAVGYGTEDGEDKLCLKLRTDAIAPGPGFHLAFSAATRASVDAFHASAIAAGGRDNGAPGLRPHYGEHYYAAFVVDPDGHHVEAVINAAV